MRVLRLIDVGAIGERGNLRLDDQVLFANHGGKFFREAVIETGLIHSRVLLNFLGVYCKRQKPVLESRSPRPHFHDDEVWIEKFPSGHLLSIPDLLSISAIGVSKQKMYWHLVRSLRASSSGTAHLTHASFGKMKPHQVALGSLYYTCWLARKQMVMHFYRNTLGLSAPAIISSFEEDTLGCVGQEE